MLFLCTYSYENAEPFIKSLKLKKDLEFTKFQVFYNNNYILLITVKGKVNSAIAVAYLLSQKKINKNDMFINIGTYFGKNEYESLAIFYINKITDYETKKCFYPDIIYKHPFCEDSIVTVSDKAKRYKDINYFDTKSSGIYEAAAVFFKPHQIIFLSALNDKIITNNISVILNFINEINTVNEKINNDTKNLTPVEKKNIEKIISNLKLSYTMINELNELLTFYKLKNNSIDIILDDYINTECKSKNEGRKYFAELKGRLA